jgi:hypothetical protein
MESEEFYLYVLHGTVHGHSEKLQTSLTHVFAAVRFNYLDTLLLITAVYDEVLSGYQPGQMVQR